MPRTPISRISPNVIFTGRSTIGATSRPRLRASSPAVPVLHLDPMRAAAAAVDSVTTLADQPFDGGSE
jgi:hypothetical protein